MQARTIIAATSLALLSLRLRERDREQLLSLDAELLSVGAAELRVGLKELKYEQLDHRRVVLQARAQELRLLKWATLSELGIADAQFGREQVTPRPSTATRTSSRRTPATSACRTATPRIRIGLSYFKEIPTDFFIMPPSYEKDQGPVIDALRELSAFADQYGDSPYAPEARKHIGDCIKKLTDHELYVARFYLKTTSPSPPSAASRASSRTTRRRSASRKSCCCWARPT